MNITLITGGSSGLGFEIAAILVKKGTNVLLVSRSTEKLNAAKLKLTGSGSGQVDIFSCDISNENTVNKLFKYITDKQYQVNYLYNAAGIGMYSSIDSITAGDIEKIFNSNLTGLILVCKTFINHLIQNADGSRIINILSTAALKGKKMESVYYAAKWGARGFSESLKDELSDTKTEVISVYPGGMKTAFWDESKSGYNTSNFMNAGDVANIITEIALNKNIYISEITINRPKDK